MSLGFKVIDPKVYFSELVCESLKARKVKTFPLVENYLGELLAFYLDARNLDSSTLAEMLLRAQLADEQLKFDLYKKLGDTSLYISGFFGDSLNRKLVDIDYYALMGETAFYSLASISSENLYSRAYREIGRHFLDYVEVLSFISQNVLVQGNESVLRLYEKYLRTGSELAKEKLMQMGILAVPRTSFNGQNN